MQIIRFREGWLDRFLLIGHTWRSSGRRLASIYLRTSRGSDHPIILNQGGANSIFYHFFHETARFCEEGGGVDCCLMFETLFVHVCCCLLLFVDACCCLLLFLAAVVAVVVVLSKKIESLGKLKQLRKKCIHFAGNQGTIWGL